MTKWWHASGGRQQGPVDREELQRLIATGSLGPDELVWREGFPEWLPVREVGELAPSAPARSPALPNLAPTPSAEPHDPYSPPRSASSLGTPDRRDLDLGLALSTGWRAFASNLPLGLLGLALTFVPAFIFMFTDLLIGHGPILQWVWNIFLAPAVNAGYFYVAILAARGLSPGISDLFRPFRTCYLSLLLLTLAYYGAAIAVGAVLVLAAGGLSALEEMRPAHVIIPALILVLVLCYFGLRLTFTVPFVADAGLGPVSAVLASWRATRGQVLGVLGLGLVAFAIMLVGLLMLFVGALPATWLIVCMMGAAYRQLSGR